MSSVWKNLFVWSVIGCGALAPSGGTACGEDKKEEAKDDEKVKDNKALREAAGKGDVAKVLALIKKGADVNWRDPQPYSKTPLTWAILSSNLASVKVLLENGADVNYPDVSGRYPVYFCHPHRDVKPAVDLLKYVLSKGGDKDVNREPGMLVSLCDHEMGPPELIPILVAAGANPNMHFKSKQETPLIAAIKAKKPEMRRGYVKALIENKADVNFKDKKGMSPLQWANKVGDKEVIDLLVTAGAKE